MSNRHGGGRGCEGAPEGAGRVALHHQQMRTVGEQGRNVASDRFDMAAMVGIARTIQPDTIIAGKTVLGRVKGVLTGEDQARRQATALQCGGNGRKLDRFWTSSDNEVDTRTKQPSP